MCQVLELGRESGYINVSLNKPEKLMALSKRYVPLSCRQPARKPRLPAAVMGKAIDILLGFKLSLTLPNAGGSFYFNPWNQLLAPPAPFPELLESKGQCIKQGRLIPSRKSQKQHLSSSNISHGIASEIDRPIFGRVHVVSWADCVYEPPQALLGSAPHTPPFDQGNPIPEVWALWASKSRLRELTTIDHN